MNDSGCYGCTQKAKELNERVNTMFQLAQRLANENNEWYGIYTDEYGQKQVIRATASNGTPIEQYVSPKL